MNKPVIGIDLDDTFIDFMTAFLAYRRQKFGEQFERHHFTTFNLHEIWKCSVDEAIMRIDEFYESEAHSAIPTVPGAIESLMMLSREFEIHAITARSPAVAERTTALVKRHAPELFTAYHFLGHVKKKGDLCHELGARVMVDDALHNAASVSAMGIPVIMLDRPWNQGALPTLTTRVFHWDEIPALVRNIVK